MTGSGTSWSSKHGLDGEHPGQGGQRERGDEAVEDDARLALQAPVLPTREPEKADGEKRVPREGEEVGDEGAARGQVPHRREFATHDAVTMKSARAAAIIAHGQMCDGRRTQTT